jgi:hypothetical protein
MRLEAKLKGNREVRGDVKRGTARTHVERPGLAVERVSVRVDSTQPHGYGDVQTPPVGAIHGPMHAVSSSFEPAISRE